MEVTIDVEEFDRYINEAEMAFCRSKETAIESYEKAIAFTMEISCLLGQIHTGL